MTDDQIKHMVSRFLGWKLPADFSPDAGISFKATFNEGSAHPMRHEPSGTNLFDATQAEAMVRHLVDGLPAPAPAAMSDASWTIDATAAELVEALREMVRLYDNPWHAGTAGRPAGPEIMKRVRALLAKAARP